MHRVPQPLSPKRPSQYHRPILRVNSYVIGANNACRKWNQNPEEETGAFEWLHCEVWKSTRLYSLYYRIITERPRAHKGDKGSFAADVEGDVAMHF